MIERKRTWGREKEINRYGVRRIDSFWTEGDNRRELMVGNRKGEGRRL